LDSDDKLIVVQNCDNINPIKKEIKNYLAINIGTYRKYYWHDCLSLLKIKNLAVIKKNIYRFK